MRRRPGAVVLVYATRFCAAWLMALPVAGAVDATGVGLLPTGDAALFEAGGTMLIEALRVGRASLAAAVESALFVALVAGVVALAPLAMLLVALAHRGRLRFAPWVGASAAHLPAFALLWGMALLAQGVVALLFTAVVVTLYDPLHTRLSERTADGAVLALLAAGAAAITVVGIVHDLARAACVRHRLTGAAGLQRALLAARRQPAMTLGGWLAPALASLAVIAVAALVVGALRVELGAARVAGAFATHQLAALSLVALRAVWLCRALTLVSDDSLSRPLPTSAGRSEDSGAPGDPSPDLAA